MKTTLTLLCILTLFALPDTGRSQPKARACEEVAGYHKLDFWVGDWTVVDSAGNAVGENRIEKILEGCAILEHWRSARGSEGKSLFYYDNHGATWKQVWVTQNATRPGGTKEKTLIEEFEDGGVRFQGEIYLRNGRSYLDRTTLTPIEDGRVRQLIEYSTDGGQSWRVSFDAFYEPSK